MPEIVSITETDVKTIVRQLREYRGKLIKRLSNYEDTYPDGDIPHYSRVFEQRNPERDIAEKRIITINETIKDLVSKDDRIVFNKLVQMVNSHQYTSSDFTFDIPFFKNNGILKKVQNIEHQILKNKIKGKSEKAFIRVKYKQFESFRFLRVERQSEIIRDIDRILEEKPTEATTSASAPAAPTTSSEEMSNKSLHSDIVAIVDSSLPEPPQLTPGFLVSSPEIIGLNLPLTPTINVPATPLNPSPDIIAYNQPLTPTITVPPSKRPSSFVRHVMDVGGDARALRAALRESKREYGERLKNSKNLTPDEVQAFKDNMTKLHEAESRVGKKLPTGEDLEFIQKAIDDANRLFPDFEDSVIDIFDDKQLKVSEQNPEQLFFNQKSKGQYEKDKIRIQQENELKKKELQKESEYDDDKIEESEKPAAEDASAMQQQNTAVRQIGPFSKSVMDLSNSTKNVFVSLFGHVKPKSVGDIANEFHMIQASASRHTNDIEMSDIADISAIEHVPSNSTGDLRNFAQGEESPSFLELVEYVRKNYSMTDFLDARKQDLEFLSTQHDETTWEDYNSDLELLQSILNNEEVAKENYEEALIFKAEQLQNALLNGDIAIQDLESNVPLDEIVANAESNRLKNENTREILAKFFGNEEDALDYTHAEDLYAQYPVDQQPSSSLPTYESVQVEAAPKPPHVAANDPPELLEADSIVGGGGKGGIFSSAALGTALEGGAYLAAGLGTAYLTYKLFGKKKAKQHPTSIPMPLAPANHLDPPPGFHGQGQQIGGGVGDPEGFLPDPGSVTGTGGAGVRGGAVVGGLVDPGGPTAAGGVGTAWNNSMNARPITQKDLERFHLTTTTSTPTTDWNSKDDWGEIPTQNGGDNTTELDYHDDRFSALPPIPDPSDVEMNDRTYVVGYESLRGNPSSLWESSRNKDGKFSERKKYYKWSALKNSWKRLSREDRIRYMARGRKGYKPVNHPKLKLGQRLKVIASGIFGGTVGASKMNAYQMKIAQQQMRKRKDILLANHGQAVLKTITN